jgi:nucleotide-binding universal stress UspA family protein
MTNTGSQPPVVVGVDGTPAGYRGVQYAALEARRLGVGLRIVHVTPGYPPSGPALPIIPSGTLQTYGLELLAEAGTQASAVVPDLDVDTQLLAGSSTARTLAACGQDAPLLVLGTERQSFAERVWTGDVVAGVAAQASCPAVFVPPDWEPSEEHRRIVVGLKSTDDIVGLLAGLSLAHARNAELVVVHAWKLPAAYDDIVANRVASDEHARQQTGLIEPVLQEIRQSCPEVPVRIEVLHAQPAWALVNASTKADRLVIMRPARGGAFHHLGAVARAVLREAHCPVEVIAPQPE